MSDNLRRATEDVKAGTTRSCGLIPTEHNIVRKYSRFSALGLVTEEVYPVEFPPLIRHKSTGIPQDFRQPLRRQSADFPHLFHLFCTRFS